MFEEPVGNETKNILKHSKTKIEKQQMKSDTNTFIIKRQGT